MMNTPTVGERVRDAEDDALPQPNEKCMGVNVDKKIHGKTTKSVGETSS